MGIDIQKDEADAQARRVPVFLQKSDGTPQDDTTGVTVLYRRPDAVGGDIDVTSTLSGDGGGGRFHVVLTTGQVDTAGLGWISWSATAGHDVVANADWVRIILDPSLARLPAALDGGFIKAQVKGIDATPRDAIAGAVWEAAVAAHIASGTFGELLQKIAALSKHNVRIDNITFDASHLMTVGRLRAFDTSAHAAASTPGNVGLETGELFRFPIAATSTGSGEFSTWLMTET